MAFATKTVNKAAYETGDLPSQADFVTLIDSYQDSFNVLQAIGTAAASVASTGVVRILGTAEVTVLPTGAVGVQLISVAATASGQRQLGAGAVGIQLIEAAATASASNALGLGTMSIQAAGAVAITGGTLTGVTGTAPSWNVGILEVSATSILHGAIDASATANFAVGIELGSPANEVLDAYNEGTWTPSIAYTGGGTNEYTTRLGWFTQVGNQVRADFNIVLASAGGNRSGGAIVSGLPVNSFNNGNYVAAGALGEVDGVNWQAGYTQMLAEVGGAVNQFNLYMIGDAVAIQAVSASSFGNTATIRGTLVYQTD